MKAQTLSHQYATAVFSLALEKWLISLGTVQEKLANSVQLAERLQNEQRPFSERQKELDKLISSSADQNVRNFLYTLLKNGDIGLLGDILADIERMTRGGPQVQVAYITTAITLSDNDKEEFRQKLRTKYDENLEFVFNVDSAIVGGAVVQIGDKVIDGSVASRLDALSNALGIKR